MRVRWARTSCQDLPQPGLSVSVEELNVSPDQRAWLVTGVVRRLLLRAMLVLGGAFAVTLAGWLLGAVSAHADVLPSVPSAPSVPSVPSVPSLLLASSDVTTVPQKSLDELATPDATAIGRHAHIAVRGAGQSVAPSVVSASDVLPHGDLVPLVARVDPAGRQQSKQQSAVTKMASHPSAHTAAHVSPAKSRSRQSFAAVARRHVPENAALAHRAGSTPSSVDVNHHSSASSALPPLQPAGSSDSSVRGGGGVAGAASGMQIPYTHPLANGGFLAGASSTPLLTTGPGRQPGTSPD